MNEANLQLAYELVDAWNAHDIARVQALFAADYEGENVAEATPQRGPGSIREMMTTMLQAFPDLQLSIDHCIAHDSTVAIFWVAHGTQLGPVMNIPPTGRQITTRGSACLEINNGKITRGLQVWDVAGMLRSIGLLPDLAA